jgi:hypothetical protein
MRMKQRQQADSRAREGNNPRTPAADYIQFRKINFRITLQLNPDNGLVTL